MKCVSVYLIHNQWSESNYKVGKSSLPSRRLGEISVGYDVDPRLIKACWFTTPSAASAAEKFWHRYLRDFQTDDHGGKEWFSLPTRLLDQFCQWSSLSFGFPEIFKWSMDHSPQARNQYDTKLIRAIPRHIKPPSIDLWTTMDTTLSQS